ncbi:MAG: sigma-70 family RNA polymerase sigma factor [Vicingaceae bacterium]|nr:sigma-70 family RNA polymerase sigma factor [Vicingaceae bacterium]
MKFEPEARRVLYDLYSSQMYSICLRYVKNNTDADDVFQQGFMLVYKNIGQLKNVDALSGWIKRIFVNVAIEFNRKKYQLRVVENPEAEPIASLDVNNAISQMAVNEITALIQQLPTGCREVFNLYVIDGFSHKEIADQLGISVGTSKSQLFDARKILKNKISSKKTYVKKTGN